MAFLLIMGFLFLLTSIGMIVWYFKIKSSEEIYLDDDLVDNFMSQHTNDFSHGTLVNYDTGVKRDGITFKPKDINYMKRLKNKQSLNIEPVTVYAPKYCVIKSPRGGLSGEKHRIFILPAHPEDIPIEMQKHPFWKAVSLYLEKMDAENTVIEVQRKRIEFENKLLHKVEGADRMDEYLELDSNLNKDIAKKMLGNKDTKQETFSNYNTGGV